VAQFGRSDVSVDDVKALCTRKGWKTGRTGCFEKGTVPPNKGKRCPEGKGGRHPNARRTQFKPGERTGAAQRHYKPIGFERITIDGYRERKINDDMPLQARWKAVHRIEWEAVNGQVPMGHALKCLSGDKLDCRPENWEAVPRGVLARLNGGRMRKTLPYDEAPPELKPIVMANAKLKHLSSSKRREAADG
jgi:hypothetical protein